MTTYTNQPEPAHAASEFDDAESAPDGFAISFLAVLACIVIALLAVHFLGTYVRTM